MITLLPLSTLYLSILAGYSIFLAYQVVSSRKSTKIGIGSGDDEGMNRTIRVHANYLENLLPFSLLFILAELNSSHAIMLHVIAVLFIGSRVSHASGLGNSSGISKGRFYGTIVSWLVIVVLVVNNLVQVATGW